jgi:subtilisin family serine protease
MSEVKLPYYEIGDSFSFSQLKAMGKVNDWGYNYISPESFHKKGFRGRAVHFVIDTMDISDHPDVEPKLIKSLCKSFINEPSGDGNGHGTWVASRIAGLEDGSGVKGIAPDSPIVGIKALSAAGGGTSSSVAQSILYAANVELPEQYKDYPRIINMSLGSSQPMNEVEDALRVAKAKGCITIAAAGNSGGAMSYPARYSTLAMAVGAFDAAGNPASFSARGAEMDFAAPGVGLYGAWKGKTFVSINGTSMATPAIAGVVDLLTQRYNLPLNQEAMEEALKRFATDLYSPGWDEHTGWGTFKLNEIDVKPPELPNPEAAFVEFLFSFERPNPRVMRRRWQIGITVAYRPTDDLLTKWSQVYEKIKPIISSKLTGSIQTIAKQLKDATLAEKVRITSEKINLNQ